MTSEMTRLFCPHCGNKTLKKVAVTVDSEGNLHMHFSRNPKVLNPRGLRVSGWGTVGLLEQKPLPSLRAFLFLLLGRGGGGGHSAALPYGSRAYSPCTVHTRC